MIDRIIQTLEDNIDKLSENQKTAIRNLYERIKDNYINQ